MAVVQVAIEDLNTWLGNQPANTTSTPYEIEVTGIFFRNIPSYSTYETNIFLLPDALKANPLKYVDLSPTDISPDPALYVSLSSRFQDCTSLVVAPKISNVRNMSFCFSDCTSLISAPIFWDGVTNVQACFWGCTQLDYKPVLPSSVTTSTNCFYDVITENWKGTESQINTYINSLTLDADTNAFEVQAYNNDRETLKDTFIIVGFNNLNAWLSNQPDNTTDTPYKIEVTGLTKNDIISLQQYKRGQLADIIMTNKKYVDLYQTVLTNDITDLSCCFYNCDYLTKSPNIPTGVENMAYCFFDCDSITVSPNIPQGVTSLEACFAATPLINAPIIPDSVVSMRRCFEGCDWLKKAPIIPGSVTDMFMCFFQCIDLTNAPIIPPSVTDVFGCFAGCISLNYKSIIPNTVTTSEDCYYNVSQTRWGGSTLQLESFVSSQTTEFDIVEIEADTENNCYRMTGKEVYGVDISNLDSWLSNADANTASTAYEIKVIGLTTSNYTGIKAALEDNLYPRKYVDLHYTELPSGINTLYKGFSGCLWLVKSPVIPSTVTVMSCTFEDCMSLVEAPEIPSGVISVQYAFKGTAITVPPVLPSGLTDMQYAFYDCASLASAPEIPSRITDLTGVFKGCTSLTLLPTIPDGVSVMESTFEGCTSLNTIANGMTVAGIAIYHGGNYATSGGASEASRPTLGEINKDFGSTIVNSFSGNDFKHNEYPSNQGYSLSENVVISDSIGPAQRMYLVKDSNDKYYFFLGEDYYSPRVGFIKMEDMTVDENGELVDFSSSIITDAPANLYSDSTMETYVGSKIGSWSYSGLYLGADYFQNNDTFYLNDTEGSLTGTYTVIYNDVIIAATTGINYVKSASPLPNGILNMTNTFKACSHLTIPPTITNSVTAMAGCFKDCSSLASAPTIPIGVTSLEGTFCNCSSLPSAPTIPNGVTNLESAFEGCSSLTVLPALPNAVTNMKNTFKGCSLVVNSSTGITMSGIAIYHGENYSTGSVSTATVPTVGSISKDFGSSLANSCNNLDFKNNEYKQSDGYALSDNVVAYRYSFYSYGIPEKTRVYLVKNLTTQKKYLFGIINYFTPAFFFINIDSINVDNLGFVLISDEDFVEIMPRYGGRVFKVYSDSTETVDITATHFGDWNLSHSFETISDDWLAVGDNFYIDWDVSDNVSSSGYNNECNGTYEVLLNDVILQSTAGIDYVKTNPAIALPSSVTNAEGCFQGCNHLETIAKIPSSVTNVKNCFDGCTNLRKIDNFQVALSVLDSANAQDCFKNCSSLMQVGFEINEEKDWHIWKLTYGSDTVEGKIYDADGTSVTIPQTSITKTDIQLPVLTDELWFPNETDSNVEAIIQKILTYKYGVFKKEVLPPDEKSFVLIADNPNNVVSNILENSKVTITSSRSLSISKDTRAIISGENITLTLPATGSTNGSILELFTTNDTSIVYYADSNTSATQTMEADSRILFVYYNGWRFVSTYGAVWN